MGNTQGQEGPRQEPTKYSNLSLERRRQIVIDIIKVIVTKKDLISKVTMKPLSEKEQNEYLARATFYFISEEKEFHHLGANAGRLSPTYDSILRLAFTEDRFKVALITTIVETICETPKNKKEEEFQKWMDEKIRLTMPPESQHYATYYNEQSLIKKFLGHVQENAWTYTTTGTTATSFGKSMLSTATDEAVLSLQGTIKPYNIATGVRAGVIAGGCYLAGAACWNACKVCRGKRSWKRAGKNMLDEVAAVSAGTVTGVVVGAMLAPLTWGFSLFFGAVTGIVTSMFTRSAIKKQTCRLFDIPEDEMLEKAYQTLGVGQQDEMDKIGREYRLKSRMHHPDKFMAKENLTEEEQNANLRTFLKLQAALAMIVAAREKDEIEYGNARKNFEMIEEEEKLSENSISIMLKIQILSLWNKIPYLRKSVVASVPAIMSGLLPFQFFEEAQNVNEVSDDKKAD